MGLTHLFLLLCHILIVYVNFNLLLRRICLAILFQLRSHKAIQLVSRSNASWVNFGFLIRLIGRSSSPSVIAVLLFPSLDTVEDLRWFLFEWLLLLRVLVDILGFRVGSGSRLELGSFSFQFFFTFHGFLTLLVNSEAKVSSEDEQGYESAANNGSHTRHKCS